MVKYDGDKFDNNRELARQYEKIEESEMIDFDDLSEEDFKNLLIKRLQLGDILDDEDTANES